MELCVVKYFSRKNNKVEFSITTEMGDVLDINYLIKSMNIKLISTVDELLSLINDKKIICEVRDNVIVFDNYEDAESAISIIQDISHI